MITYKYLNTEQTHVIKYIDGKQVGGGLAEDKDYLAWLAEGNQPLPADEATQ